MLPASSFLVVGTVGADNLAELTWWLTFRVYANQSVEFTYPVLLWDRRNPILCLSACQCNGHSKCVNQSICEKCENLTTGKHCETCISGFYGDPTNGGKCQRKSHWSALLVVTIKWNSTVLAFDLNVLKGKASWFGILSFLLDNSVKSSTDLEEERAELAGLGAAG